jgi:hypothetical protein
MTKTASWTSMRIRRLLERGINRGEDYLAEIGGKDRVRAVSVRLAGSPADPGPPEDRQRCGSP